MQYTDSGQDPYCYPGTTVLKNLPGITDEEKLQEFEADSIQWQQIQLEKNPIQGNFDLEHLQKIHLWLFEQVYEWAGKIRTVNIGKDGFLFASYPFIEDYARTLFAKLAKERATWNPSNPPENFIQKLAEYLGEINSLHPFREGNGRTQRIFIGQLAKQYGIKLDWEKISASEMIVASKPAMVGNNTKLEQILTACAQKHPAPTNPKKPKPSEDYGDI